ncbi:hypothetical protein [Providencia stuartii]|uniref:hypothetical protein n=1 Tax=Providencia stuartii TaxID=588 RepID=UPI0030037068
MKKPYKYKLIMAVNHQTEEAMASQGFKNPNQFRKQLDEQLKISDTQVKGYRPERVSNSKRLSPPKKP